MEEQQVINTNKSELWNLSLKDLFYKYVRFLPMFLLSVAITLLAAFAYLRYSTRVYSATGNMLIKSQQQSAGRTDKIEDLIEGGNKSQNIQTEIEILKSRPLMERVVQKLALQFNYTAKGKIKDYNIYKQGPFVIEAYEIGDSAGSFVMSIKFINGNQFRVNNEATIFNMGDLFRNKFGVFSLKKNFLAETGNEFTITWNSTENVARGLAGGIVVQPKTPGTSILSITLQGTNAHMAADIINSLMIEYDSMTVEQNNHSNDQMLEFINSRLTAMNNELDSLQLQFLNYKQVNKLFDIDKQLNEYLTRLSAVDNEVVAQEFRIAQVNEISKYLEDKKNEFAVTPSSLALEDVTLSELIGAYNKAQLERQGLLDALVPPENLAVKQAEGLIESIRTRILENTRNIRLSYNASVNQMKLRKGAEQSKLEDLPYKLKAYVEMERQINTKLVLFSLLESKREEGAISRASTISNSKVIDRAVVNPSPVKPNKRTIQIMAILIGILVPALGIFIGEVLNDKISTRHDIEKLTQAPILGEIGHSFSDATLVVSKTSRTMVAEQFRIIRSNLQYVVNQKDRTTVLLVTSSFSGEGKSFVSTNMAAVVALAGKKTIILEFDIRKPKILSGLGLPKRSGITNYLLGKAELEDLITPVPNYDHLFLLACGPVPPNPSEMLLGENVTELFRKLGEMYDVIVIDTAPVGMVSDALTLSKFADCTLYLVRQGHTFKKQIVLIDELYRENKLPKVSIVINDVKNKPGYGYYGYGRYGYGYGYGYGSSYYEEEKAPLSKYEKLMKKLKFRRLLRFFKR